MRHAYEAKYDAVSYLLENENPFHKQKLVANLISSQSPDGGWNWFRDLPSNPAQTVGCLEQLVKFGIKVDLQI